MPNTARILPFPDRRKASVLNAQEARAAAEVYLAAPAAERDEELVQQSLGNPEVLFAICGLLRERRDVRPSAVAEEAVIIYRTLQSASEKIGLFDEWEYLTGEAAFLAGGAFRQLGRRNEALRWLDRAEAGFRHTVNPGPGLSNVAYARLALRFEMAEYDEVLELLPSVCSSFEKLKLEVEVAKCHLLEAMTLKQCGRSDRAMSSLKLARAKAVTEPTLAARVLSELGDLHQLSGDLVSASDCFDEAVHLLEGSATCIALADLRMFVGAAYWGQNKLPLALEAFRAALADYSELGMQTRVAYLRLFAADALIRLDRHREAEWEILAALPTIEEQKMVPEGFAAVALLRESVSRRKTDPNALRELREHLQKNN